MKDFIKGMRYAAKIVREKEKRTSHVANHIMQEAMNIELAGRDSIFRKKAKEFL